MLNKKIHFINHIKRLMAAQQQFTHQLQVFPSRISDLKPCPHTASTLRWPWRTCGCSRRGDWGEKKGIDEGESPWDLVVGEFDVNTRDP